MQTLMRLFEWILSGLTWGKTGTEPTNYPSNKSPQPAMPNPPKLDPIKYAADLAKAVADKEYVMQKDDPKTAQDETRTFCNFFTRRVASWFNCQDFEAPGRGLASQMVLYMGSSPHWKRIEYTEAPKWSSKGHLVIAGWRNPDANGHGHLAIVIPEDKVIFSNSYQIQVPFVANVGKDNFYGKALSFAFGVDHKPDLYLYLGA